MAEAIVAVKPDVVGFSTWCNYYLELVKATNRIRKKLPGVKILFGGVQATHTDRETIEAFPQIDVVARGECDHTISQIISSIHDPEKLRRVRGLTFMQSRNSNQDTRSRAGKGLGYSPLARLQPADCHE